MKYSLLAIAAIGMGWAANAPAALTIGELEHGVIFGSGNANGSYTIDRNQNAGLELGLRGKLRFNASGNPENTFNSNGFTGPQGFSTYSFDTGVATGQSSSTGVWNFEWSINTDFTGVSGQNLNAYTYQLGFDTDASLATNFVVRDVINAPNLFVWEDHAFGTNSTQQNASTGNKAPFPSIFNTSTYWNTVGSRNVAQNSYRPGSFSSYNFDPTVAGIYNIYLAAFDGATQVARTDIQILVGQSPPVVPVPAAAGLGLLGMGVVGVLRHRKNA